MEKEEEGERKEKVDEIVEKPNDSFRDFCPDTNNNKVTHIGVEERKKRTRASECTSCSAHTVLLPLLMIRKNKARRKKSKTTQLRSPAVCGGHKRSKTARVGVGGIGREKEG